MCFTRCSPVCAWLTSYSWSVTWPVLHLEGGTYSTQVITHIGSPYWRSSVPARVRGTSVFILCVCLLVCLSVTDLLPPYIGLERSGSPMQGFLCSGCENDCLDKRIFMMTVLYCTVLYCCVLCIILYCTVV